MIPLFGSLCSSKSVLVGFCAGELLFSGDSQRMQEGQEVNLKLEPRRLCRHDEIMCTVFEAVIRNFLQCFDKKSNVKTQKAKLILEDNLVQKYLELFHFFHNRHVYGLLKEFLYKCPLD